MSMPQSLVLTPLADDDGLVTNPWSRFFRTLSAAGATAASAPITVPFSATPKFDGALGNVFLITLTGNVTGATYSNLVAGQWYWFIITQDGTGGRTFTWSSAVTDFPSIDTTGSAVTSLEAVFASSSLTFLSTEIPNPMQVPHNWKLQVRNQLNTAWVDAIAYASGIGGNDILKLNATLGVIVSGSLEVNPGGTELIGIGQAGMGATDIRLGDNVNLTGTVSIGGSIVNLATGITSITLTNGGGTMAFASTSATFSLSGTTRLSLAASSPQVTVSGDLRVTRLQFGTGVLANGISGNAGSLAGQDTPQIWNPTILTASGGKNMLSFDGTNVIVGDLTIAGHASVLGNGNVIVQCASGTGNINLSVGSPVSLNLLIDSNGIKWGGGGYLASSDTAVTPGTYAPPASITVDQHGRITAIS